MAPKYAPKVWKRPHTSIYSDNYRYGNSLYSDAVDEIEKKYNSSMAATRLGYDRPDLGFSSFADSQLTGESVARNLKTKAANESLSNEIVRSLSTERVNSFLEGTERRAYNLATSPTTSFENYLSQRKSSITSNDLDDSRLRRSSTRVSLPRRPMSTYYGRGNSYEPSPSSSSSLSNGYGNDSGPRDSFWMERWYQNSMRSVKRDLYPSSLIKAMTLV